MPDPEEVAQLAYVCAREAVDRLVELVGSSEPWADGRAQPERALITLMRTDEDTQTKLEVRTGHAALALLMAASAVLDPHDGEGA